MIFDAKGKILLRNPGKKNYLAIEWNFKILIQLDFKK